MVRPTAKEYAVILNQNARRVTERLKRSAETMIPRISLYTTRTKDEAYQYVREIIDNGYRRIISGGGDGTLFHLISAAKRYIEEKNAQIKKGLSSYSLPQFGVLRLGTGNSLASLLGTRRGLWPLRDLANGEEFGTCSVNLIEAEHRCFTFSGLGWDAAVLNDYLWLKQQLHLPIVSRFLHSIAGYLVAIFFKTIPSVVARRKTIDVRITNEGDSAYYVRSRGSDTYFEKSSDTVLYEGPCTVTGVGTTPFYGYGLKAFPFAMKLPGFMHLRIVKAGVVELLSHARAIWTGTYRSPNFIDVLAQKVHLSFSEEVPLQIGGDAEGLRREITYTVSNICVELIDFRKPLPHAMQELPS